MDDLDKQLDELTRGIGEGSAPAEKAHALVPGIDAFLGHGYDIFGEFASPNSVRARIYDLPSEARVDQATVDQSIALSADQLAHAFVAPPEELKLIYSRPKRVGYTDVFQSSIEVKEIDAKSNQESNWGIGSEASGSYMGFSGEVKGRFDTKSTQMATTKCLQATFETIYWKLDVGNYTYKAPPPIEQDVKDDFADEPVDRLMEKYGTHSLEEIGVGTKIIHSYTIDTSKFSKSMDVTSAIKAKYQGSGFDGGASAESEYHDSAWNDRSAVSVRIFTYGTSDSQLAEITDLSKGLGEHPLAVLRQGWHNPTLIKFYKSSLKPLWEVRGLMSEAKAKTFEARFRVRAASAQADLGYLFKGLQPLYLLSKSVGDKRKYRLERTVAYKDWTLENDGKVWLHISDVPRDGMVPLFQLGLNKDLETVRYEAVKWADLLKNHAGEGYSWERSGDAVGYVYPPTAGDERPAADAVPVYAYLPKDGLAQEGVFYSRFKELIWDKGQWVGTKSEFEVWRTQSVLAHQAELDKWWDEQSWWYRHFSEKPGIGAACVADPGGDPYYSVGIPHWYAVAPG